MNKEKRRKETSFESCWGLDERRGIAPSGAERAIFPREMRLLPVSSFLYLPLPLPPLSLFHSFFLSLSFSLSIFRRSRPRLWPLMFFIKLTLAARASALLSAGLPCLHNIVYNSARAEFHFIPTAIVRRRLPGPLLLRALIAYPPPLRRGRAESTARRTSRVQPRYSLSLFLSRSLDFYPPRWRGQPRVSAPSVFILARKSSGAHFPRAIVGSWTRGEKR